MRNTFAFIELTKTLAHACHEIDALLDILPGGTFRKFLNAPHGCLFDRHSQTSSSLPLSTKLTYRSEARPRQRTPRPCRDLRRPRSPLCHGRGAAGSAVSYTHLTLPTIYSV